MRVFSPESCTSRLISAAFAHRASAADAESVSSIIFIPEEVLTALTLSLPQALIAVRVFCSLWE